MHFSSMLAATVLLLVPLVASGPTSAAEGQTSLTSPAVKTEHAKLHADFHSDKNIVQETQAGHDVESTVQVINEWVDNSEVESQLPAYPDHRLLSFACGADAIVVGSPTSAETSLNQSGDFLFTDYRFHVEAVIKSSADLISGADIIVTRPGGISNINGHSVKTAVRDFPLLMLNTRYLLFLRYLPATKTYKAFKTGTFALGNGAADAVRATDPRTPSIKTTKREDAFVDEVRAASAASCLRIQKRLE